MGKRYGTSPRTTRVPTLDRPSCEEPVHVGRHRGRHTPPNIPEMGAATMLATVGLRMRSKLGDIHGPPCEMKT